MRLRLLVAVGIVLMCAAPAAAHEDAGPAGRSRGDGGLHVSGGGVVSYVGGSGSISGTVRGPGGSAATRPPKPAIVRDTSPSAVTDGVVAPARLDVEEAAEKRSQSRVSLALLVIGIAALAVFAGWRRLRRSPA